MKKNFSAKPPAEKQLSEFLPTESLEEALAEVRPGELDRFLRDHEDSLLKEDDSFSAYMKKTIMRKQMKQSDVFLKAGVDNLYAYRLLSQERHTLNRDIILRICIGAGFDLKETQRALRLGGYPELYPRRKRDAVLSVAIRERMTTEKTDELLARYGLEPLSLDIKKTKTEGN